MNAAQSRAGQRDQLALVPDAPDLDAVPAPRAPAVGELRVVPELGAPGRELDRWRVTGREARVLTPFSATACTGNAGLCGVCTGGPCAHDLEHQHDQHQHDQQDPEHEQEQDEPEREIEDEEIEP